VIDYIIVGLGISGVSFCQKLKQNQKSFVVVDHGQQSASRVGSGLFNPIALKRTKPTWRSLQLMTTAIPFYKALEIDLGIQFVHHAPILKIMQKIADINDWHRASAIDDCKSYIKHDIVQNINPLIKAPLGFGTVKNTGWVDTALLIERYSILLESKKTLIKAIFDSNALQFKDNRVRYGKIEAKYIVFTQGVGLISNPMFSFIPLQKTKGELMVIECDNVNEKSIIHGGVFMIPIGNNRYRVGSTYNWRDKTEGCTSSARISLQKKLNKIIRTPYQIINQSVGFRPTTPDRRPVIGVHPKFPQLAICNGMGSRGVLQAPFCAGLLYDHIEKGTPISKDINLNRFKH
jgi:glycine/D-amino acid oxidase-like deaminating enzyme